LTKNNNNIYVPEKYVGEIRRKDAKPATFPIGIPMNDQNSARIPQPFTFAHKKS
jgi:hypothetical protein